MHTNWLIFIVNMRTHEFIIYVMLQQVRVGNLTLCYYKKRIDVRFQCVCPVIDNKFCHNIVVCGSIYSYFDNVMTKFIISNRTDA